MSSPSDWQRPVNDAIQGTFLCLKCGFRSHQDQKCPRCGVWSLRSPNQLRNGGSVLIVGGTALILFLGLVIVVFGIMILRMPTSEITPTGVWNFATLSAAVVSCFVMSLLFVIEGLYRVATKRPTKWIVKAATWQLLFFAGLAAAVRIGVRIYVY